MGKTFCTTSITEIIIFNKIRWWCSNWGESPYCTGTVLCRESTSFIKARCQSPDVLTRIAAMCTCEADTINIVTINCLWLPFKEHIWASILISNNFPQTWLYSIPDRLNVADEQPTSAFRPLAFPHRRLGRSVVNLVSGGHWWLLLVMFSLITCIHPPLTPLQVRVMSQYTYVAEPSVDRSRPVVARGRLSFVMKNLSTGGCWEICNKSRCLLLQC